jgi:hypothetical protein
MYKLVEEIEERIMIGTKINYGTISEQKAYSSFSKESAIAGNKPEFEFVILTEEKSCYILWRCKSERNKADVEIIEVLEVFSIYDRDYALEKAIQL